MEWLIVGGCVIGTWALLSVLGSERDKRLEDLRRKAQLAAQLAKEQAAAAAEPIIAKSK